MKLTNKTVSYGAFRFGMILAFLIGFFMATAGWWWYDQVHPYFEPKPNQEEIRNERYDDRY